MTDKEQVKAIRTVFTGYDKTLNSKVKKPEKYGIQLIPEAAALITDAEPQKCPEKRSIHRAAKVIVRMSKTRRTELQRLCRANCITVQDFLLDYITESIKKAAAERTLDNGNQEKTLN